MEKLRVENLTKIFGKKQKKALKLVNQNKTKEEILAETGATVGVNNASFSVNEGEVFVIMGLSGSGKSTLVRMLNRLIEPTQGSVYIDNENIAKISKGKLRKVRRNKISMVFQNFGLFPFRTILENTEYGLEVKGVPKEERRQKAEQALENAGLLAYKDQLPSQLSGGMQQRVGLARALANDPDILLMDEAFSALDPLIRRDMQDELLEMQKQMNKTIIFITHDLNEALRLGGRIAIMKDGEVVQVGTGQEILMNPANDYVERFVEDIDRTKVVTAGNIMNHPTNTVLPTDTPLHVKEIMETENWNNVLVVSEDNQLVGYVVMEDVDEAIMANKTSIEDIIITTIPEIDHGTLVEDIFDVIHESDTPIVVTDDQQDVQGVIVKSDVIGALTSSDYSDMTDEETLESENKGLIRKTMTDSQEDTVEKEAMLNE